MFSLIHPQSGLLSDVQIRELCTCPTMKFDEAAYNAMIEARNLSIGWPLEASACEDIRANYRKQCTVHLTEEEKLQFKPMISPYVEKLVSAVVDSITKPMGNPPTMVTVPVGEPRRIISYGQSSYGYDARLARDELKIFTNLNSAIVDPYEVDDRCFTEIDTRFDENGNEYAILPPNSFMLGHTVEYFNIPRDVLVMCLGKSTLARAGSAVTVTPLEPGWHGHVTIEIANLTSLPLKIYTGVGICQFLFFRGATACETSYADRGGKYNGQTGTTLWKV